MVEKQKQDHGLMEECRDTKKKVRKLLRKCRKLIQPNDRFLYKKIKDSTKLIKTKEKVFFKR